jgi:hypothetical protein
MGLLGCLVRHPPFKDIESLGFPWVDVERRRQAGCLRYLQHG